MNEVERDFHMEEFRQLKSEISTLLERVASLFKYGLIGSATVYSWFLTHWNGKYEFNQTPGVLFYASLIPPVLVFFFGLLALATYRHVSIMGRYLKKLERELGERCWLGWETYWRRDTPILLPMLFVFYLLLLGAEIWISVWVYHGGNTPLLLST